MVQGFKSMMYLLILAIIIVTIYFIKNKITIKWKTFLLKKLTIKTSQYGVYCYCGKQGSGKTYSVVEYLQEHKDKKIFSNVTSIKDIEYESFNGFTELLKLRNKENIIIVFDELFTALAKGSKITPDVMDFLSQMRKRKIIFITTAQEWLEIPITFRRYCRYQIDCKIKTVWKYSFLIKKFFDAELMKWDNLENEYIAPILKTTISKLNTKTGNAYDTFEQIKT